MPLLSLAIWVPIAAALLVLAAGGDRHAPLQRAIALAGALFGFLVTLPLYAGFKPELAGMQFVELVNWIPRFGIHYHLGVVYLALGAAMFGWAMRNARDRGTLLQMGE